MELGNANETQNWVHKIKFCDYKQEKAGLSNNVIKKMKLCLDFTREVKK